MPISPARQVAFDILLRIETQQAYAAELLHGERTAALSLPDRGLCMEIVMGVLRWRSQLDSQIARFSFTPFRKLDVEVLTALRMGVYQLEFLLRIPARAAINESVELVKRCRKASAAPLANAILRKIPKSSNETRQERHAAYLSPESSSARNDNAEQLATGFAHPQWLIERWLARYGPERTLAICRHNQQVPQTTVRLRDAAAEAELLEAGIKFASEDNPGCLTLAPRTERGTVSESAAQAWGRSSQAALLSSARRIGAGDPTRTRAYSEGRIVIQDEGSQLVAALVSGGRRILDCCAAPGGKTLAMADRNAGADIVAVEIHEHRARLLRKRLSATRVPVITADARALPLAGGFDRVLADVPCSGTGTLARNPEIKWRLQPADLADLQNRQVAILRGALQQLAPGGRVVYSSCSLEPEENEQVIERTLETLRASQCSSVRVLECRDELLRLQAEGGLIWPDIDQLLDGPYLRTLPGVHPCDGFFAAILEIVKPY